jgi:hypothetical protein
MNTEWRKTKGKNESCWGDLIFICMEKVNLAGWLRQQLYPMRPMARGLAQHGGPPGWLEESYSTGMILYVMGGPYRLPFPYRTGCPDRSYQADGIWNF